MRGCIWSNEYDHSRVRALLWRRYRLGMDDKAFRSWTNVIKRIASDQRKLVLVVKSQCIHIARINDFERAHLVTVGMGSRIDGHFVANLYVPERAKEGVTVTGNDHISRLPRQGRAWNMSEAEEQSLRLRPFQND